MIDRSRRWRRVYVRIRVSSFTVPFLLLLFWASIVFLLARIADSWIVGLAAMPIAFAVLLTMLIWWAYRRDFYA